MKHYTVVTLHVPTAPANGEVDIPLAQKVLNAKCIRVSELKLATTAVPFTVQLRFNTQNRENLTMLDQLLNDTYVSMGTQVNQVWHDKHEFPGLPAVEFPQSNSQLGRIKFRVTDEDGTSLAWTSLALRLLIEYEDQPHAKDSMNWTATAPNVTGNSNSAKSTMW